MLDGYYMGVKWQCVEYARRWWYLNFGGLMGGVNYAWEIWDGVTQVQDTRNGGTIAVDRFVNGGAEPPAVGDLLVWNQSYGGTGHVAVITSVSQSGGYVRVAEQNIANASWGVNSYARQLSMSSVGGNFTISAANLYGWKRCRVSGLLVNESLVASPTRTSPQLIYALPSEYGADAPVESEKNLRFSFSLQNVGSTPIVLDDHGVEVLKGGVHQFDLRLGSSTPLPAGATVHFDQRAWITDARLDGSAATTFTAKVQYQLGGVWHDGVGSGSTVEAVVYPRPALGNGMLVKQPRPTGSVDPELGNIYYHQWGYRWWIASEQDASNLFPGWQTLFYVFPQATIGGLKAPKAPSHNSTTPILTGRNLLFKQAGLPTVYILEPEPGTSTPLRSRPFSDENAFWSYGYSPIATPTDLTSQTVELPSAAATWIRGNFAVGSVIRGSTAVLSVLPATTHVDWSGATVYLNVENLGTGTMNWVVTGNTGYSWMHITGGSGTNSGVIQCDAGFNATTTERAAIVTVTVYEGASNSPLDVRVVQAAHPAAGVYTVKPDGSGDYPTIQAAINSSIHGDVILLADGTFTGEGNRNLNFHAKRITLRSASADPTRCIIDVQGSASATRQAIICGEGETPDTRIEYITMRNGYHNYGGAIAAYASPTISGCIFENNTATQSGGAVYLQGGNPTPTVSRCVFRSNSAGVGGAIYMLGGTISENTFESNNANVAGALYSLGYDNPRITGNIFKSNTATGHGTAIRLRQNNTQITNNVFYGQESGGNDLGVVYVEAYTSPEAVPSLSSNTFASNDGTAVWCEADVPLQMFNNIIAFSAHASVYCAPGGSVRPALGCNAFWANGDGNASCGDDAGGNFVGNPRFCDMANANLSLGANSPCLSGNHPSGAACGLIGARGAGCDVITAVDDPTVTMPRLGPLHSTPNPFVSLTTIRYMLPASTRVRLCVYDVRGRLVRTLRDQKTEKAGPYSIDWDGRDDSGCRVVAGLYFCRLQTPERDETTRVVMIR